MKRSDLASADNIAPGIYVIDGDENDPAGRVVNGPFPDSAGGRVAAMAVAAQLHERTGRPASVALVVNLPA